MTFSDEADEWRFGRAPDPSTSRKMGTYFMANLLFKVYFKLNSTSLCKNLTNGIKHSELAPFESYPASHRVSSGPGASNEPVPHLG